MNSRITVLILIALVAIQLTSCEKWRCIKGNDNRITETREPGSFIGVISESSFEVEINVDTTYDLPEIKVTADENLLAYIITEISGQDLFINTYDDRCLKSDRPIMVYITMPDADYIELEGSGEITCSNIDRERFEVNLSGSGLIEVYNLFVDYVNVVHTGSGEIELEGRAIGADYTLEGSGRINGYHMELDNCYVVLDGSGDVIVWVWDELRVDLLGSGFVYYRVRPSRTEYYTPGSGDIIPF